MNERQIDYLDLSLWNYVKEPEETEFKGRSLMSYFTDLDRGDVRIGVAGKVSTAESAAVALDAGADFVLVGRSAILHHDFPERVRNDPLFLPKPLPVTPAYLSREGVSPAFAGYLRAFQGFVAAEDARADADGIVVPT